MWEIELACRWDTLHARDRVTATISPAAQLALTHFVDSEKTGLTYHIPKAGLDRFRQPK